MIFQTPAFSVEAFCTAFKIGKTKAFCELSSGRLISYQVGRRRYISAHAADAWQRGLELADIESKAAAAMTLSV